MRQVCENGAQVDEEGDVQIAVVALVSPGDEEGRALQRLDTLHVGEGRDVDARARERVVDGGLPGRWKAALVGVPGLARGAAGAVIGEEPDGNEGDLPGRAAVAAKSTLRPAAGSGQREGTNGNGGRPTRARMNPVGGRPGVLDGMRRNVWIVTRA